MLFVKTLTGNMSKTCFLYTQVTVRMRERARRRALFDISLKEISNYYYDSLNYISGNLVDAFENRFL